MCLQVHVKDKILSSLQDLIDYGLEIVPGDYVGGPNTQWDFSICLCIFDVELILNRSGVKWKEVSSGYEIIESENV